MRKFNENNKVVTNFLDKLLNKDDVDKLLSNEVKKNIIRFKRENELEKPYNIDNKGRKKV